MSSFIVTVPTYSIYGEPSGKKHTCRVCGAVDYVSNRNELVRVACPWVYNIREWDGTLSQIHAKGDGDYIIMVYKDGVTHRVFREYFYSVVVEQSGYGC